MQSSAHKLFTIPTHMPKHKILSVDIGGTLAKMAFYVPKGHKILQSGQKIDDVLGHDVLPCKFAYFILTDPSRNAERRYDLP